MLEWLKLAQQTPIYLESESKGERQKHAHISTPIPALKEEKMVLLSEKKNGATCHTPYYIKKDKNGTFVRKKNEVTGLKLWNADTI